MEKKAYVERIMAFITNQQTGRKEEDGEPAPVPPGPQPIITIDGVDYYNKCEFDLATLVEQSSGTCFDLISGETTDKTLSVLRLDAPGPDGAARTANLSVNNHGGFFLLFKGENPWAGDVQYTSRAFTPVDTQEEVGYSSNKLALPTCSAYYGFLSEDHKTFISYFNLKD